MSTVGEMKRKAESEVAAAEGIADQILDCLDGARVDIGLDALILAAGDLILDHVEGYPDDDGVGIAEEFGMRLVRHFKAMVAAAESSSVPVVAVEGLKGATEGEKRDGQ